MNTDQQSIDLKQFKIHIDNWVNQIENFYKQCEQYKGRIFDDKLFKDIKRSCRDQEDFFEDLSDEVDELLNPPQPVQKKVNKKKA